MKSAGVTTSIEVPGLLVAGIAYGVLLFVGAPKPAVGEGETPVTIECCVREIDLREVGACLSGPNETEEPTKCGETGRCFYSEGGIPGLVGFCTTLVTTLQQTGLSLGGFGINHFSSFDFDQDGDFDLRDFATFQNTFESSE